MLDVRNLCIRSTSGIDIVRDVSFQVRPRTIHCLVGESGSGKSMTALSIMGLQPETAFVSGGKILFRQHSGAIDLRSITESERQRLLGKHIAFVFQNPRLSFNPVQKVGAALEEYLRIRGGYNKAKARKYGQDLFQQFSVTPPAERYHFHPYRLSGGLLQRISVIIPACLKPALIIADEPTSALDARLRFGILELFEELRSSGSSILLITHDLSIVREYADDVTVLREGARIAGGSSDYFFQQCKVPYVRTLLEAAPVFPEKRSKLPVYSQGRSRI